MDCHLFCHNELPSALLALSFAAPAIGAARAWIRRRVTKKTGTK